MKKLNIISCVTNEKRFAWETAVYLYNLTSLGYKDIHILIFVKKDEHPISDWVDLIVKFPDVEWKFYIDTNNIYKVSQAFNYTPLYRFWLLQEYFREHPNLKDEAILYTDTDIILTKYLDFSPFLEDDINYLSWTGSKDRMDNYLWQRYFDAKLNQVNPSKIEQYKKLDILARLGFICNTTREHITENNPNTGGAQYLLKNIDSQFWTDCFNTCSEIKLYLSGINQTFMKGNSPQDRENNGFQSFCSDMWALLYNLWGHGYSTSCPVEMDFAWSTDRIERVDEVYFIHNAGILPGPNKVAFENEQVVAPLFFKGRYSNTTPFEDLHTLEEIIEHPISSKFANSVYTKEIINTYKFLNGN